MSFGSHLYEYFPQFSNQSSNSADNGTDFLPHEISEEEK
jgi:hypothetical protein